MGLPSLQAKNCVGKSVSIYVLIDPRDSTGFYVGATTRTPGHRLSSHIHDAVKQGTQTEKSQIIRDIVDTGLRPEVTEIEVSKSEDWVESEQFWIEYFKSIGCNLTNVALGGAGAFGTKQSEATRIRRQVAAAGRDMSCVQTKEARNKVASKLRHKIQIDGVTYDGIAVAARTLGKPYSTIQNMLDTGCGTRLEGPKVGYLKPMPGMAAGSKHGMSRPVVIDGNTYWGLTGAARELGIQISTVQRWLKRGKAEYADKLAA